MSGLIALLGQRVRRDWVQLVLWIGGTAALAAAGYGGALNSYGDEQERAALLATVLANPVILLFRGLPSGAGEAQLVVFLLLPWLLLLAALMSTFLAVRHTRGDEEDGRLELLAATPAARWTPTVATAVHGAVADVMLGTLVTVAFVANGAPLPGAVLVGLSCTLIGVVFLGTGLMTAQLMATSRGANSLSTWILVGTFVLAGAGNALGTPADDLTHLRSSWLTWLSPFGWAENTRAFDEDAWAPIALLAALAAVLIGGALALQSRRDLGAAFVPERAARPAARAGLASNLALVTRLSAPSAAGWVIAGILTGVLATSLGAVANEIGGENPAVAEVLRKLSGEGGDLARGIVVVFFVMLGILAACAGVQTVIRARQDEVRGTAELVLSTPLSRVRWLVDYLAVALGSAAATLAGGVAGATLGGVFAGSLGGRGGDASAAVTRDALIAGAGQLLPAWVFAGLTAVVFAFAPRLTISLGWTLVAVAATVGLFGPLFGMDQSLTRLSPFAAAPTPTDGGVDPDGLWWIALAAALSLALAVGVMRHRDLRTG